MHEGLTEETGYASAVLYILDLASFASVSAFADKLEKENERLDIAVHNATLWNAEYVRSQDGWESRYPIPLLVHRIILIILKLASEQPLDSPPRAAPSAAYEAHCGGQRHDTTCGRCL